MMTRPSLKQPGGDGGCFGIVAWAEDGQRTFGAESIMLAAGSNIDWLRDDLKIISSSVESHDIASSCSSTDGVMFVPAPLGLGTPHWDYGARSTFVGLTRGTTGAHMVRAVVEELRIVEQILLKRFAPMLSPTSMLSELMAA